MTLLDFIKSLSDTEVVILAALFLLAVWGCVAPYFSLLHLGGIERQLGKNANMIAELKRNDGR